MVSFAVQKLSSLIRSHFFISVFISITIGGGSKKILLQFMSEIVLPMFPPKSFIVSKLRFRVLIHFEFILCIVLGCILHVFLHIAVQFFQHHLLKRLFVLFKEFYNLHLDILSILKWFFESIFYQWLGKDWCGQVTYPPETLGGNISKGAEKWGTQSMVVSWPEIKKQSTF